MNYFASRASINGLAVDLAKRALIGTLNSNQSSVSAKNNQVQLVDLVRKSNLTRLHLLAERLVRANNIKFHVQNKAKSTHSNEVVDEVIEIGLSPDLIGDCVNFINLVCAVGDDGFIHEFFDVPIEVQRGIRAAKVEQMEGFIIQMMRHYNVTFSVDMHRVRAYQHSVDKTLGIEDKKEFLLLNKAPMELMKLLYSEESDKTLGARKKILQIKAAKGRPKIGTDLEYFEFVRMWQDYRMPLVDKFLKVHEDMNTNPNREKELDFSVLFGFYKRNEKDQEEISTCRKLNAAGFGMPNSSRLVTGLVPDYY